MRTITLERPSESGRVNQTSLAHEVLWLARIIHRVFTLVYGFFWSLDKRLGVIGSGAVSARNLVPEAGE